MNPQEHKGSRDLAIFLHSQLSTAEATQDPREVDLSDGPGVSPLTPLLGKNPQEPREPGASKEQSRERCSPDHTPRAPQTATLTLLMDPPPPGSRLCLNLFFHFSGLSLRNHPCSYIATGESFQQNLLAAECAGSHR